MIDARDNAPPARTCWITVLVLAAFICLTQAFVMLSMLVGRWGMVGAAPLSLALALAVGIGCARSTGARGWRQTTPALLALAIFVVGTAFSAFYYDLSWDGQQYHQSGIYALAGDWNALANPLREFEHSQSTELWVRHYAKGPWYFAAAIFDATGYVEWGKSINLLALAASGLATSAFVATHFAAAAAALSWMLGEWLHSGKPSMLGGISGAVAGLVAITPASGFVKPMPALLIGLLAGLFCFWMVTAVKRMFGYDDTLDAFGVHGAGGTLGAILTGVFATNLINDAQIDGKTVPLGLVDGNPMQILNQGVGVLIAVGLAAAGTFLILKVCDAVVGMRVDRDEEEQGLDLSQHGEEGYILEA